MGFRILALICAVVGSFVVLAQPLFGFAMLITALFFAWVAQERRSQGKDRE